jgi:hypothetical protein
MSRTIPTVLITIMLITMVFTQDTSLEQHSTLSDADASGFTVQNGSQNNSNVSLAWEWALNTSNLANSQSPSKFSKVYGIDVGANGDSYVAGTIVADTTFGNTTLIAPWTGDVFVAKISSNGTWLWVAKAGCALGNSGASAYGLSLDSNGSAYIVGSFWNSCAFGNNSISSNGYDDNFVAKISSSGVWQWAVNIGTSSGDTFDGDSGFGIEVDSTGDVVVTANLGSGSSSMNGNCTLQGQGAFVAKISNSGNCIWALGPSSGLSRPFGLAIDSNDDVFITGNIAFGTTTFGNTTLSNSGNHDVFAAKISSSGSWVWANSISHQGSSGYTDRGYCVAVDTFGDAYIVMDQDTSGSNLLTVGNSTLPNSDGLIVAKISGTGTWQWATNTYPTKTGIRQGQCIAVSPNGNVLFTGDLSSTFIFDGTSHFAGDVYVGMLSPNGTLLQVITAGGPNAAASSGYGITIGPTGDPMVAGFLGPTTAVSFGSIQLTGPSIFVAKLAADYDGDGYPDSVDDDIDGDAVLNQMDNCLYSPLGFFSTVGLDRDGDGCRDSDEDDDDDGDGMLDDHDSCPQGATGWHSTNLTDVDGDGCADAMEDIDDDNDGFEDFIDVCPRQYGNSTMQFEEGCPDDDGDGRPDFKDPFPNDSTEWLDSDGDGVGDNSDAFRLDITQSNDTDGDGYGDYLYGNAGDGCPLEWGDSVTDLLGCPDFDGDGWSNQGDAFVNDSSQWIDRDGDGYGDNETGNNSDAFPTDGTQWKDSDGDGHGDNPYGNEGDWFPDDSERWQDTDRDGVADEDDIFINDASQWNDSDGDEYGDEADGNRADVFPNDPGEWIDSDGDGLGNNADAFPFDPTQTEDRDGDGMGDNPMGIGADKFPDDATQWGDIDGDGFGDNPSGTNPDAFITDATQWSDEDGDGYGDNPTGRMYDQFPQNPTQWVDDDGDGLGDNLNGTDADPYLNDFDNDGYNDSIDTLPKLSSPGDLDADGCLDEDDAFPSNSQECLDSDGDGEGDNADVDDDNDGWADTEELRLGTDPFNSAEEPVDSFEIVIPGTSVGLGAWDLIGMFGGIPLFVWIGFGFVTRNTRCAKYEAMLREANTRDELESVAYKWEYSLMLRMLGPHQGIRLERLRAELDDKFEAMAQPLSSIDNHEFDQTQMVVEEMNGTEKQVPELVTQSDYPSIEDTAQKTDENGYEWFTAQDGTNFYRTIGSQADWIKLEN